MAKHTDRNKRPQAVEPDYAAVPPELRGLRQWVLWGHHWNIKQGAWVKMPYQPNGQPADTTDKSQWSTFESCLATFEQTKGKYDGIGFVFSKDDEYIGIDLDQCVTRTEDSFDLTPFAARVVEKLNTYTELSPSLTGLHLIGKSSVLTPVKTKFNGKDDIEMYGEKRYFTFTGRAWHSEPKPIADTEAQAKEIVEFFQQKSSHTNSPIELNIDIEARLKLALKNTRTKRVFDGDISEYGNDDSKADIGLLNMLAYYSDGRADVLDAMFRQSKLMREKWDSKRGETTYGLYTIEKVLERPRSYLATKPTATASAASYDTRKDYRFTIHDLWDKAMTYRESGDAQGVSTGWKSLDEFYRPTKRSLHIVTGKPSSGKSTWVDALCYNLAQLHNWKFTFASFETLPIERHVLNLCQIHLRKPTFKFLEDSASDKEMERARDEIAEWFYFLLPPDDQMDIHSILSYVDDDLKDYGISGFVLDPFTELDQTPLDRGFTQTQNIKEILKALQSFTRRRELATWLIAHPTKPSGETWRDGRPTLYSIDGSANFYNKTDFGLVVHRTEKDKTVVHIEKVRNDVNGKPGEVEFDYDKHTKQYSVLGEFEYREDDDIRFRL